MNEKTRELLLYFAYLDDTGKEILLGMAKALSDIIGKEKPPKPDDKRDS